VSDDATNTSNQDGQTNTADTTSAGGDEFRPITSQEDLQRVLHERLQRERAKYADYKDVKAKASKLDEIEQANKSEIDKAMDRVTKAEAEVSTVPAKVADALRSHLVALHEIDADDAELFLTANDPDLLLKQVARLTGRKADQQKKNNVSPREGTTTTSVDGDERQFARNLFGG
jgi:hypothetical protein